MAANKNVNRDKLVMLYKRHRNVSIVAEILGLSFNTTKYHLRKAGEQIVGALPRPPGSAGKMALKPATPWDGL